MITITFSEILFAIEIHSIAEFESLEKSKSNYLDKKVKIVAISNENHLHQTIDL